MMISVVLRWSDSMARDMLEVENDDCEGDGSPGWRGGEWSERGVYLNVAIGAFTEREGGKRAREREARQLSKSFLPRGLMESIT